MAFVLDKGPGVARVKVHYRLLGADPAETHSVVFYGDTNGMPKILAWRCFGFCNLDNEPTGSYAGTGNLPSGGSHTTNHQSVAVSTVAGGSSPTQFLAISNARLKYTSGTDKSSFCNMRFYVNNLNPSPAMMVLEGVQPAPNKSPAFINWGGSTSRVVTAKHGDIVSARYASAQTNDASQWQWFTDGNGYPSLTLVELPSAASAVFAQVPGRPIPDGRLIWTNASALAL